MKILTEQIVRTDPAFQTNKYTLAATNSLKLPNCTTFACCAWHYLMDAKQKYQMFARRAPGGFPNAKDWYNDYLFEKGPIPKVGAIAVWNGAAANGQKGHVAIVKEVKGDSIVVYQSNYGGNYFEEMELTPKVGVSTPKIKAKFIGYCYHPYLDVNAPLDKPEPLLSVPEVAQEVVDGKWGNNPERKAKLIDAGYNYNQVQAAVNTIVANSSATIVNRVANEVLMGKWGNNPARKQKLIANYFPYSKIQERVNQLVNKK